VQAAQGHEIWTRQAIFRLDGISVIEELKSNWKRIRDEYRAAAEAADCNAFPYPLDIMVGTWLISSLRSNPVEYSYMTPEIRHKAVLAMVGARVAEMTAEEIDETFMAAGEEQMAQNRRHHPTVTRILEPLYPAECVSYNFSLMKPGVVLRPHQGLDAGNIRAHLCLIEDEGCILNVAGESCTWHDGDVLAFDDHSEHWVAHGGTRDRLVLIVDFSKAYLRGELSRVASAA
jgi:aspartyl/asparaginyl beta-hydroxylase (cupin superfamily)